jgi:teichoic acid transport system ATP-binding protein
MLGMRREDIRSSFDEIVDFAGLKDVIGEPVKHYSMGMRARLAFSIAVALDPDLLILDEALNAGDAAFQQKAAQRLRALMARARAVIVVSHNLRLIESVCTRGLWLDRGKVMYDGEPSAAVRQYRAWTAATAP